MRKHLNMPAVQPDADAALKPQNIVPMARSAQGVQARAEPGAQARAAQKPKGRAEEDEVQAEQSAEQGPEGLAMVDATDALAPAEMGSYQLAQVLEVQVAAGGVGAGVTGVGLAGAAGAPAAASLGAAGVQTASVFLFTPSDLLVGAAGVVGAVTAASIVKGDDSAPTVMAAQSFSYRENSAANASVGTVAATDNVGVTGFRFTQTGTSTSADGYFSIGASGVVTLTAAGAAAGVASNDFETGANSFTYGVQACDAAGNWSASSDVTFNLTDLNDTAPLSDDWADSYSDVFFSGLSSGPLDLSGATPSPGYIEVAGDLDLFGDTIWWSGVYEINVTGQLTAADLDLYLEDSSGQIVTANGVVDFALQGQTILLSLDNNASTNYQNPGATYFKPSSYGFLGVGADGNKTGSYSLSIDLIDDFADQVVFVNGQWQPNYGVTADQTRDLGLGAIVKTNVSGAGKAVKGLFNAPGDIDIWKYEGAAGDPVTVSLSAGASLSVRDHQGHVLQAINGTYTLTGDTYLHVSQGSAPVGSDYRLELLQGFFIA